MGRRNLWSVFNGKERNMDILGKVFEQLESYSWLGSATNFVHLEDSLDVHVAEIGKQIAMDLTLTKVITVIYYLINL